MEYIHLLYQPDALYQMHTNVKYTTPTCFGKDMLFSANTESMLRQKQISNAERKIFVIV
jgi:hypothetical protein